MQETLKKIDELYNLLVEKNKTAEVLNQQLSEKKRKIRESFLRAKKMEASVIARERALDRREGSLSANKEAAKTLAKAVEIKLANRDKERELAKREKELKDAKRNYRGEK